MKKWIIVGVGAVAVLAAGAFVALGCMEVGSTAPNATPTTASTLPPVRANGKAGTQAKVVPVQWAALAFPASGRVVAVAVQEGDTVSAGQELVRLDDAALRYAVETARANLASAEAHLAELQAGAQSADIAAAQANLDAARAELAQVQRGATQEQIAVAEARVKQAQVAVNHAQSVYDRVKGWGGTAEAEASYALNAAYANLELVKAELAQVKAPATPEAVAAAQARVTAAQAALDRLKAGAAPEVAVAQAQVDGAKAALGQAEAALSHAVLKAPFAGTIARLDVRAGEMVTAGVPVVWLADVSAWWVETTDLTELSVVGIHVGDPATITFDAIPGLELSGKVTRIQAFGVTKQGDITYAVTITPDRPDDRLRWNMTAAVTIGSR